MSEKFDCTFVISGEPASKANSRKIVTIKGRTAVIKSEKARSYMDSFRMQVQAQMRRSGAKMTEQDVRIDLMIHYASRRPDLDESVILDAMQGVVYVNDRQVKHRQTYWGLDPKSPRAVIRVRDYDPDAIPEYLKTPIIFPKMSS
jgi:hypothetical protein